jgi:hypothetical protein
MSVNLPKTNPFWVEQRLLDGGELNSAEVSISNMQTKALTQTLNTLNQPVQEGDMMAAKARVDALKEQFESLTPPMKEFMYNSLQTKMGKHDLSELFHYKLSTSSRNALLKTLNPEHGVEHVRKENINEATARETRAGKTMELDIQGSQFQRNLKKMMDEIELKKWTEPGK